MEMRVKGTPFKGEVTGNGGTAEKPLIELTTSTGERIVYPKDQLTALTISESLRLFIWSVFNKDGSRKSQLLVSLGLVSFGVLVGLILGK